MTAIPIAEKCDIKLDKRPALSQGPLGIEEVPDRKHLYDQYGNYLSTVSTQSANKMRTYNEFANMISEGVSDYRNHLEVKDEIHADGKRFSRIVKFPNETFDFSVNGKVEPYMLVMWAWTSYDLGWAEQYIFGPLCIICFNGQFTAAWKIQALSKKNWTKKADMSADDIANTLIGIKALHEQRCQRLWDAFEEVIKSTKETTEPKLTREVVELEDGWYEHKVFA